MRDQNVWMYKCNSTGRRNKITGDWRELFNKGRDDHWGSTKWTPELSKVRPGDIILAYQSDRNELVGLVHAVRLRRRGAHQQLIVRPGEPIGVKVRPLKQSHPRIARIPALRQGPIGTLFPMSPSDANALVQAARRSLSVDPTITMSEAVDAAVGAGFGTFEENRRVERASMKQATSYFRSRGWEVTDVSSKECGYDLHCYRGRRSLHVEVKGARGEDLRFIITDREKRMWFSDRNYRLAFVGAALSIPLKKRP